MKSTLLNKNNFWNPVRDYWDKHLDGAGWSLRHFLDKVKEWHFNSTSNEVIWPQKNSNSMQWSKSAILAIFQTGQGWLCTVSAAFKNPSRDFKNLFALGADDFLAMLEGKIREGQFFKVQSGKTTMGSGLVWHKSNKYINLWIWPTA